MTNSFERAPPSAWLQRFAKLIPAGGEVLDLASGAGRHARFLAGLGYRVEAVDRDPQALGGLQEVAGVSLRCCDIEAGAWPYAGRVFAGVVVTNYLFRPRLDQLLASLADPGVLIYETFMVGNECYGRPSRPEHLLKSQEMLSWVRQRGWRVLAFEEGYADFPRPSMVQRLCAAQGVAPCPD